MSDTKYLTKDDLESINKAIRRNNMEDKERLEKRLNEALALLDKYKTVVESLRRIVVRVVEDAETALDNSTDVDDQYDYLTTSWDDEDESEYENKD